MVKTIDYRLTMAQQHKLIEEILSLPSNKERVKLWMGSGLHPNKGLSEDFTRLMFQLYEDASGDTSMRFRYNCSSCLMIIYRKLEDFLRYNDNMGKPLINWYSGEEKGITILIPCSGKWKLLEETLNSIFNQAATIKKQVLIGLDQCPELIKPIRKWKNNLGEFIVKHDIDVFYFKERVGPYLIKNSLLKEAKWDKIIFMDADDIMGDNMIERCFNGLDQHEQVRFYCQDFIDTKENSRRGIVALGVFATWKNNIINTNGFYPWRVGADSEWALRTQKQRCLIDDDIIFYRRLHQKSLTNDPTTNHTSDVRNRAKAEIQRLKRFGYPHPKELSIVEYKMINGDGI